MPEKSLRGQVALITGGSKRIGRSIALRLASDGADIIINYDSSKSEADSLVAELKDQGRRALAVQADVSHRADVQKLFTAAENEFGRLDILVNNSGAYEFSPIESFTEQQFHKMFDINVLGLLLTTQAAVPHLGEGATVINIGSVVSSLTPPGSAVYTGTKGAVDAISGVLAKELGARKIRVNSINPGMVETEGTHAAGFIGSDFEKGAVAQTPLGRIGQVDDIASVATFLASNDAQWITGELVRVGGGLR